MPRKNYFAVIFLFVFLFRAIALYAEELSYDRYAPSPARPATSNGKKAAAEFLTYPLEIFRQAKAKREKIG